MVTEWTQENLWAWPVALKVQALLDLLAIPGYPPEEIALMVDTVIQHRPVYIFEWGTNRGSSARIFYETARLIALPCEIHTTELPDDVSYLEHPGDEAGLFVRDLPVEQHRGEGLRVTLELMELTDEHHCTIVFIDGDHSPDLVYGELRAITDTRPGAVVLLHDTGHDESGPREAVEQFLSERAGKYAVTQVHTPIGMTRLVPR